MRPPSTRPKEQGIRHVNLENFSTATNKPVYPWQTGKGPIKSMVHCSNLTYGIGRGCNKPEGVEVWPFTCWHVSQWWTKDVTCWAKRGHQTHYDNAQITFRVPKCTAVDVQCSSCIIRLCNPREPVKTNCKLVCNTRYKLKPAVLQNLNWASVERPRFNRRTISLSAGSTWPAYTWARKEGSTLMAVSTGNCASPETVSYLPLS